MFCDEVLDAVEPIAAGELTPDGRISAHLASCPQCAAALASARHVEQMLERRPVPLAPPQFTARTLARVRRARWRSEQVLDVGFNVAIGAAMLAVIVSVWVLVDRSGLAVISRDVADLVGTSVVAVARRAGPSVPLYAGATALLASALGIWWWAERDGTW